MVAEVQAQPDASEQETQVDAALQRLSARKAAWASASLDERLTVLKEIRGRLLDNAIPWAHASAAIRCKSGQDAAAYELFGNVVLTTGAIDSFIASLTSFKNTGKFPQLPTKETAEGQAVIKVFPHGKRERYLSLLGASGLEAEIYIQPGKGATQGRFYSGEGGAHSGRVCAVLGAGNQGFLTITDVLSLAFVDGCVVLVKYHDIQAPAAKYIDHLFEPLRRWGAFASTTCGLLATRHLLYSPLVDCVHMTGGTATHDVVVWGAPGEEQERRKAANDPLLKVPITSELGCVTPWLVVPGPWTEAELDHHVRQLVTCVWDNCSCNCLAPKVLLLPDGWEHADTFLLKLRAELATCPLPAPYYPGIRQRYEAFRQQYPGAEAIAAPPAEAHAPCGDPLPWLLNVLPAYPADPKAEYAFRTEPFAPVLTVVKVSAPSDGRPAEVRYLEAATRAANDDLWGTLSCVMLVHPETERQHPAAVLRALEDLRYGAVTVNGSSSLAYAVPVGTWGAHGGSHTLADIGSGIGMVHNGYMYDAPQKSVVRTPFMSALHPMPPHRQPIKLGVAKVVAGLSHSGLLGLIKLLRQ